MSAVSRLPRRDKAWKKERDFDMKRTIDRMVALVVLGVMVVSIPGCANTPAEVDGRSLFESRISKDSNGLISLISFTKRDGLRRSANGMDLYVLEYEAEISFSDDCIWGGIGFNGWNGSFRAKRGQPDVFSALSNIGSLRGEKGGRRRLDGSITFVKSENGWRAETVQGDVTVVNGNNIKGSKVELENSSIDTAKSHLRALSSALNLYRLDNFRYPTGSQGLRALVLIGSRVDTLIDYRQIRGVMRISTCQKIAKMSSICSLLAPTESPGGVARKETYM